MALPEIIKELLESGVHFGHLSKHWNPKMSKFIFGKKKNIYIIDLEKTAQKIEEAKDFVKKIVQDRGQILFVGTKRQLRDGIKEEALTCGMPYVVERWVGGFLTNFSTIRTRIKRYVQLLQEREKGGFKKLPRKEVAKLNRQIEKMERNYNGVVSLESLPSCIYVVDPKREIACVREAVKLSIPIVGLIDTDADPNIIDYPIPGNDDAIKSVRCITAYLAEAIRDGQKQHEAIEELAKKEETKEAFGKKETGEIEAKVVSEVTEEKPKKKRGRKPVQPTPSNDKPIRPMRSDNGRKKKAE